MEKSVDAFRTISEVAEDLVLPQHVLRFWETRFPQIRPLKRAGGRRYYRPTDIVLLRSIRQLLYDDGYTIKGVQRLLKEKGARGLRSAEPTLAFAGEPVVAEEEPNGLDPAHETDDPPSLVLLTNETAALDNQGLKEVLACIEECRDILQKVHRSGR